MSKGGRGQAADLCRVQTWGRRWWGWRGIWACWVQLILTYTHTHAHSVHLLLVNQFGGVHKVLAIKQDDSGCNRTSSPPEHHISQGLCPRVAWKTKRSHLCCVSKPQWELVTWSSLAKGHLKCFSRRFYSSISLMEQIHFYFNQYSCSVAPCVSLVIFTHNCKPNMFFFVHRKRFQQCWVNQQRTTYQPWGDRRCTWKMPPA